MARPRPAPPKRRVVEPSAWLKRSKRRRTGLLADANAGVLDLEAQSQARAVGPIQALAGQPRHVDPALPG